MAADLPPGPQGDPWGGGAGGRSLRLSPGLSLAVLLAWMFATLVGGFTVAVDEIEIPRLLGKVIAWNIAAGALIAGFAAWRLGLMPILFRRPLAGSFRALWLPLLYLVSVLAAAWVLGPRTPGVTAMLLLNSLLIGLSEELMFRGLLYRGLRQKLGIRSAMWVSTLLFGAIHVLNALQTGNFPEALAQAAFAGALGLVLAAIMLRTGTLTWCILYHALWDFAALAIASGMEPMGARAASTELSAALFLPVALVLPNVMFGLWLIFRLPRNAEATARA